MTRRLRTSRPATVIHGKLVRLLKLVFLGTFVTVSRAVLQKVPSEANPKVRNHGEGPY